MDQEKQESLLSEFELQQCRRALRNVSRRILRLTDEGLLLFVRDYADEALLTWLIREAPGDLLQRRLAALFSPALRERLDNWLTQTEPVSTAAHRAVIERCCSRFSSTG